MEMPGRNFNGGAYRFGFNGKENDNEVKGDGNEQDYGMRIYDPRLARFLSVDPLTSKYPELTPYQFASNTPIEAIDLDGGETAKNMTPAEKKANYMRRNQVADHSPYHLIRNLTGQLDRTVGTGMAAAYVAAPVAIVATPYITAGAVAATETVGEVSTAAYVYFPNAVGILSATAVASIPGKNPISTPVETENELTGILIDNYLDLKEFGMLLKEKYDEDNEGENHPRPSSNGNYFQIDKTTVAPPANIPDASKVKTAGGGESKKTPPSKKAAAATQSGTSGKAPTKSVPLTDEIKGG
jgi:RHS repeat-associated protein